MNRAAVFTLALLVTVAAHAQAPAASDKAADETRQVVTHHLQMIDGTDLDAVVADYSPDVVMISPQGVTHGTASVRRTFANIGKPGTPKVMIQKQYYDGHIGYITWTMNAGTPQEMHGSDTFEVQNGKITVQTVVFVAMHPAQHN